MIVQVHDGTEKRILTLQDASALVIITCQRNPFEATMISYTWKRELMVYKASTRLIIASIPAPNAPIFFEAVPVYGEVVAEDPRLFVPDGRIGEPVAADPGPEPKPPDGPAKPLELAIPVALTYPPVATTAAELSLGINKDL